MTSTESVIVPEHGDKRLVQSVWMLGEYRRPLTDIVQREREIVISVALPAVQPPDVRVHLSPEGVEVWARRRMGGVQAHDGYYRFIPLSNHESEHVSARIRGDVLELRIPLEVSHAIA